MKNEQGDYKLRLTGVGVSIERSISELTAQKIIALVMGGDLVIKESTHRPEMVTRPAGSHAPEHDPMGFMTSKRAKTDMERITCLAFFLKYQRGTPAFKTKELTELNIEAAQAKLSNPSATARNAVTHGYLSLAGNGRKQITAKGEALVTALPDRDKVQESLAAHFTRKLRKRRKRSAK